MIKRVLIIGFGLVLFAVGFSQLQSHDFYNDLHIIQGDFEYIRSEALRQGRTEYKIKLVSVKDELTILSFIKPAFNHNEFKKDINSGDHLTVYLDKENSKSIAQIEKGGKKYVDESKRNNKRKLNGYFALLGAALFIFFGIKMKK